MPWPQPRSSTARPWTSPRRANAGRIQVSWSRYASSAKRRSSPRNQVARSSAWRSWNLISSASRSVASMHHTPSSAGLLAPGLEFIQEPRVVLAPVEELQVGVLLQVVDHRLVAEEL